MNCLRRHLQPAAWIALVAMLALALLPTLSHALASAQGPGQDGWAEVCTPQGLVWVALDDAAAADGPPLPASAFGHLEHCPFCHLGGDLPAALPAAAPGVWPAPVAAARPAAAPQAPPGEGVWSGARARAPPAAA